MDRSNYPAFAAFCTRNLVRAPVVVTFTIFPVCGSGLVSRACLADVTGHGESVAVISQTMHDLLRALREPPG